ncbi:RND family transporter [Chloroflexota bacterium]
MKRIADFTYDHAKLIIILVVVINIIAMASFYRFNLDTDFLSFFNEGNPRAEEYNQLNQKYQSGESINILLEDQESLLTQENLIAVFNLQQQIDEIDGVSMVRGFIPPEIVIEDGIFTVDGAFINANHQLLVDFIENKYFFTRQFLIPSNLSGMLAASLEADAVGRDVVKSLESVVECDEGLTISLAGNAVVRNTLKNYLLRVLLFLPPCAITLVLLIFYCFLRKFKFTIMAMIPAGLAALWTFGSIFWSGQELNIASVISPMFIIVMGAADGLHYLSHFKDNMAKYPDRRQLMQSTLEMVGMPIFLTTITTMAGFASLVWTDVIPMRHMGIFVALGIGYAGLLSLFFLPALLSRVKLPEAKPEVKRERLTQLVLKVSRQRLLIVIIFTAVIVASAVFIPRLEVVSNQLMFFKKDSEIRQTFAKVEASFGGALPLIGELITDDSEASLIDYQYANRVLALERELESLSGIDSTFSVFDLIKGLNKMATGSDSYPQSPLVAQTLLAQIEEEEKATWISDYGFRVIIKTKGLNSGDVAMLDDFVAENQDIVQFITGMPVLFDEMNQLVVQSQTQSLALALVLIFIMLWLTLRNIGAALVGLLPVAITILAIMGMLAVTSFNLNIMTATLSAIAIGVGVDYSIHLISGIFYFQRKGKSQADSVDSALKTVSGPVLTNAFGLAIGLSALFFSPLLIHTHVASVMWVAMVVSSIAALFLIPIFYSWSGKSRK